MDIISYATQKDEFLSALSRVDFSAPSLYQFSLLSSYMAHYHGARFSDHSFILADNNGIKAIVPCAILNEVLTYQGAGIRAYFAQSQKKTLKLIYDQLVKIAQSANISKILIDDPYIGKEISAWGYEAQKYNALPKALISSEIDLTQSDDQIHSGIRDSYRSLINAARRTLTFEYFTSENITPEIFKDFQKFHFEVSGRITRNDESWLTQYEMVKSGCAELIIARMEGYDVVASSLFTDYAETTSYAVAVYNRELFDKPLAHAIIYDEIFRAKGRGKERFFLGLLPHPDECTDKELSIARFKKGFCDRPSLSLQWTITLPQEASKIQS